jgi:hypothetical protein
MLRGITGFSDGRDVCGPTLFIQRLLYRRNRTLYVGIARLPTAH